MIEILYANDDEKVQQVKTLFGEYESSLGISLEFQDFAGELAALPGEYSPPDGCLLIALWDGQLAGCVALRKVAGKTCEMKRLFVRSQYHGLKIGRTLAEAVIDHARRIGYKHLRLDTLPSMERAKALYISLGFTNIPPYRYNPIEGATFMELTLR